MTAKDRARKRLEQYQIALRDTEYCQRRIETLREQAMHCTTAPGEHSAGWTGEYVTELVRGKKTPENPKPKASFVSVPVQAIPCVSSGARDPKSGEKYLVAIIDQIREYEQRIERNMELCRMIEAEIDAYCAPDHALALKYRYVDKMTNAEAQARLNYSAASWYRLFGSALEEFGAKIESV